MGKKVLISGGSRGIGAAAVEEFAGDGDQVVFLYQNRHDAAQEVCRRTGAMSIAADVSDPDAVRAAVKQTVQMLGGLDVLVCNAGISQIAQDFATLVTKTGDEFVTPTLRLCFIFAAVRRNIW